MLLTLPIVRNLAGAALWRSIARDFWRYDFSRMMAENNRQAEQTDQLMAEIMAERGEVYVPYTMADYRRDLAAKLKSAWGSW